MSKPISRSNNGKEPKTMNITDWKTLPADVIKLFRKYRLISEQTTGTKTVEDYTRVNLRRARDAEGKILGDGFLLAQDALQRFVNACVVDGRVDCAWLDWILFQVAGGQEAQRRGTQAMEQVRERFLDERMRGFRDTKGQYHAPMSRESTENKWKGSDPRFQEVLFVADQDMCEKIQVFGFHRHWPGPGEIYKKAAGAVRQFLDLAPQVEEMNTFLRKAEQTTKIIPTTCKSYEKVDALIQAITKIERFFNSRAAREDVRIEPIYADGIVEVFCPITYSAAVRYGWDAWPISDRSIFEQCLEGSSTSWNDPWRKTTGDGQKVPVFFRFKVPMPSWITYSEKTFERVALTNICALLPRGTMTRIGADSTEFMDEENRKVTIEAIVAIIEGEVKRSCDPDEEEYPIKRGPRVFETAAQAEAVSLSFALGWKEVVAWAAKFNPKQIVIDYMPK
jgi:hypothetical protein